MAGSNESLGASGMDLVGYRLRRAQISVFQRFLATFESLGLRPAEYSVLVLIAENPGRKQIEIAEMLAIKRANIVPLIHGLAARGLVERRPSAGDRRANALHLTRAGGRFMSRARRLHDTLEADLTARLGGPVRRRQLIALLDRLS